MIWCRQRYTNHCFHDLPTNATNVNTNTPTVIRNRWKTALETASQKRTNVTLIFADFLGYRKKSKRRESSNLCRFSTWTHLGHQGRPMELRGEFQEHFLFILERFRDSLAVWRQRRQIKSKKDVPRRDPKIRMHEQRTTTSSTTKQVARARWRGWAKPSGFTISASYNSKFPLIVCWSWTTNNKTRND